MMERKFTRTAAYRDPSGKYGINSGTSRYAVIGDKGAVEFWYFNHDYTETTPQKSLDIMASVTQSVLGGVEIHSKEPTYEDQRPVHDCTLTGGDCYCDGSSLWADEWHKLLVHSGSEAVFAQLEIYYAAVFLDGPQPDLSYNPNGRDFPS